MSSLKCLDAIGISIIALHQKMISNDASNVKYIDNFIFVFAPWICGIEGEKSGVTKWTLLLQQPLYGYSDQSHFFIWLVTIQIIFIHKSFCKFSEEVSLSLKNLFLAWIKFHIIIPSENQTKDQRTQFPGIREPQGDMTILKVTIRATLKTL